jgi:large repetitive protein
MPAKKTYIGFALATLVLAGCGNSSETPDCDPIAATLVSRVEVKPSSVTLADGESVQLAVVAYSCDGSQLAAPTIAWQSADATTISVSSTGMAVAVNEGGPVTVTAVVQGKQGTARILVAPRAVASVRVEPATATVAVGRTSTLVARALDAQGAELPGRPVVWSSSDPGLVGVSAGGAITGVAVGGPVTITATIEGRAGSSQITVVDAAVASITVSPPASNIPVGATVQLQALLRDDQGTILAGRAVLWSTSNAALATVSGTGLVTGVAPGGPVTILATSEGRSGSAQVTLNPLPLTITTSALSAATVGAVYSQALAATGGVRPYSWSVSSGTLPTGITLSSTGVLSGTPGASGSFSFTVRVGDAGSQSATQALTLQVGASLTVTTTGLPPGTIGSAYSSQLTAAGGTAPYSWVITSGTLPAGLNLSSAGLVSGTPTVAGSSTFVVQVSDGSARTATQALTLTIISSLDIATSTVPDGTVGTSYSQQLSATGGTPPYTWSVTAGSLPDGLTLGAGGLLSGTPTAPGSFSFTAGVADAGAGSATQPLTLVVVAPVSITTTSLPPATSGVAYSQAMAAAGGSAPYTWSVAAGALPGGLTLSSAGELSGTPAPAGDYSFTLRVVDGGSRVASQALTITVVAGAAARIVWLQQPTNSGINEVISPAPSVRVQDIAGNAVNVPGAVEMSISRPPGTAFTASSTTSAVTVGGVATFSALAIAKDEKMVRLRATVGSISSPESANFRVR